MHVLNREQKKLKTFSSELSNQRMSDLKENDLVIKHAEY